VSGISGIYRSYAENKLSGALPDPAAAMKRKAPRSQSWLFKNTATRNLIGATQNNVLVNDSAKGDALNLGAIEK